MEALFCFRQQFFCLMAAKIQGQPQKPRQLPGHIGPEFPQGPQQRRSRQQIQQHPRPGSQQQIQLRLAAAYPGQGPQGPQQAHQAEHRVGGMGQPRPPAAQHPQQVIYQAPGTDCRLLASEMLDCLISRISANAVCVRVWVTALIRSIVSL